MTWARSAALTASHKRDHIIETARRMREDKPMTDEDIIKRTERHETIAYAEYERLVELARTAATLQERVKELEAKLQKEAKEGHELHEAYLRIRAIIPGAWKTRFAPTSEQVWKTTEDAAEALRAREAKLIEALRPFIDVKDLAWSKHFDAPSIYDDDDPVVVWLDVNANGKPDLVVGDFRRARTALEQDKPHD